MIFVDISLYSGLIYFHNAFKVKIIVVENQNTNCYENDFEDDK